MKKTMQDLGQKKIDELEKEVLSLRGEMIKLKLEKASSPAKDTNLLSKKKKRLSQVLTILSEKRQSKKI